MKIKEGYYRPVYMCKLCNKQIVDMRPTEWIHDEDINKDLEILHEHTTLFEENTRLHYDIDLTECFGLCSIIGFKYKKES